MLKENPMHFSKMCMNANEMEMVITAAIEQLKEKNDYDCYRDDLLSQYNDNVTIYWKAFVAINTLLLGALLVCAGYLMALRSWFYLYFIVAGALIECFNLYRGFKQLSFCRAISNCLFVISLEKPELLRAEKIQQLMENEKA